MHRTFKWPELLTDNGKGIAYGGDYNPDQWSEDVWDDDVRLMKQAGVNTVAVAIFSWDRIQPEENRWDFGWLDRIIDKLGKAGIAVDLASATATAPLWLYEKHPEAAARQIRPSRQRGIAPILEPDKPGVQGIRAHPVPQTGRTLRHQPVRHRMAYGQRIRLEQPLRLLRQRAQRFRLWCERKYGTIENLNKAWGTTFWGQEMNGFHEVLIPRFMGRRLHGEPRSKA